MVRSLSVILLADKLVTYAVNSGGEATWLCGGHVAVWRSGFRLMQSYGVAF